jgi:hypothetical protein
MPHPVCMRAWEKYLWIHLRSMVPSQHLGALRYGRIEGSFNCSTDPKTAAASSG